MVAVDRSAGGRALLKMVRRASEEVRRGRQLIIFPGGNAHGRPGRRRTTRPASRRLYADCRENCLPVALNSGLFWPRRTFMRYPGHAGGRISRSGAAGSSARRISRARFRRDRGCNRAAGRGGAAGAGAIVQSRGETRPPRRRKELFGSAVQGRLVVQHQRQLMQLRIAKALRLDRSSRSQAHSRGCCRSVRGLAARNAAVLAAKAGRHIGRGRDRRRKRAR